MHTRVRARAREVRDSVVTFLVPLPGYHYYQLPLLSGSLYLRRRVGVLPNKGVRANTAGGVKGLPVASQGG